MDYEKKYKEALERVRRLHDRMRVLSSTDALVASSELEFIFPELAESEDERIMKTIRQLLETARDAHSNTSLAQPYIDALAWLEKQKEQKPTEWSEEDENNIGWIVAFLQGEEGSGEVIELMRESLISWLRSLRPQYHGDVTMTEAYKMGLEAGKASSWKPSEHQMDILKAVKDYVGKGSGYWGEGLGSLIEDLEKL